MLVRLLNVRLGFNDLFKAKSISGSATKFSATFILGSDSECKYKINGDEKRKSLSINEDGDSPDSIIHKIIAKVAKEKFGELSPGAAKKVKIWVLNKADGSTTRDEYVNDEGEYYGGFDENTWYISAAKREDKAPGGKMVVLDQGRNPIGANRINSGDYVNAIIDIYATDNDGNAVCASLEGVQLLRKGENLGFAPVDAANEFEDEEYEEGDEIGSGDDDDGVGF